MKLEKLEILKMLLLDQKVEVLGFSVLRLE